MPRVLCTLQDSIGTITLANPEKHNALSAELVGEITAQFTSLREQGARVVILCSQPGAAVWSAGHDVRELPTDGRDPLGWDDPLPLPHSRDRGIRARRSSR